jgi:hypothetical protein
MCVLLTCIDRDPYSTPRAGSFERVDAVLPWRFEEGREEPEPSPPPVPPKNDLKKGRSAAAAAVATIPERVTTPWLLRRVKTPVTQATPTALAHTPQKASSSTDIRGRGSPRPPKPEPPAYHVVPPAPPPPPQQPQPQPPVLPSEERLARTSRSRPAAVVQSRQSESTVQVQPRTPPKPAVVAHRSAARGGGGETQRNPTSHSGCPPLRSVRSAPQEERSRRSVTRAPPPPPLPPLRPAAAMQSQPELAHLPSYYSAQPFPPSPAPPPYRASAEDGYPTSVRSRSLPRSSRNKHGGSSTSTFEKEAATPLPPLPSFPQLSSSALSRIQASFQVSKQLGDAIMKQELQFATPTSDHHHSRLDPVPNPRLGRRFLSAGELLSHRKAKLCADKITPEHEARLRTSNKSSPNVARYAGDSRQRTVSAHPGRGQDKGPQRGRR